MTSDLKIVIVDYGMGNLGSIQNMLKKVGVSANFSRSPDDLIQADRLILPGVGSFDAGMYQLSDRGYIGTLEHLVLERGKPILGICLGMQLFTQNSEEGRRPGLGWINAETRRLILPDSETRLKTPHMGWSSIKVKKHTPLFPESDAFRRFYFVHSFHVVCADADDILSTSWHGLEFTSSICRGNIFGCQFHPEKSHRYGIDMFRDFLAWNP